MMNLVRWNPYGEMTAMKNRINRMFSEPYWATRRMDDESDMGMWSPSAGDVMRFRSKIGAKNLKMFFNIVPEFAFVIGTRSLAERAKSAIVSSLADVILVSGPMAGEKPPIEFIKEVKDAIPSVPVFLNTGARKDNIGEFLKIADGVIVGSSLKVDGYTWNKVDPARVKEFMDSVAETRELVSSNS